MDPESDPFGGNVPFESEKFYIIAGDNISNKRNLPVNIKIKKKSN